MSPPDLREEFLRARAGGLKFAVNGKGGLCGREIFGRIFLGPLDGNTDECLKVVLSHVFQSLLLCGPPFFRLTDTTRPRCHTSNHFYEQLNLLSPYYQSASPALFMLALAKDFFSSGSKFIISTSSRSSGLFI
jgi:hypothetical protein